MGGRKILSAEMVTIERCLVSDFVRLCIVEGVEPRDAYEELGRRLGALKELKAPIKQ